MPDPTNVSVTRTMPGPAQAAGTLAYTDGLSAAVPLVGSALAIRVRGADVEPGDRWEVAYAARPVLDPGQLVAQLETVGEPALLVLFGTDPPEPYRTWKALWRSNQPLPYRLGAVLLALAARTDEARRGGRG